MHTDRPIRGVNLGGWLVLERWITPSVFAGTEAPDEYSLSQDKTAHERLSHHRNTFITETDMSWLADHGLNAVRIPVGYWLFGDIAPYKGSVDYLDKAFVWAERYGLHVLISLHGAPGSQNGEHHSGRVGIPEWHRDNAYIQQTLHIIKRLAERYGGHKSLWGIELLNEPSPTVPISTLTIYYQKAYQVIRETCGRNTYVVFSDRFKPRQWRTVLGSPDYANVMLDTHQYHMRFARHRWLPIQGHVFNTRFLLPRRLWHIQRHHQTIVGEWSLALDAHSFRGWYASHPDEAYRAYGRAQLTAYTQCSGWFYWTYKTEDEGPWNLRSAVARGWLPDDFKGKRALR